MKLTSTAASLFFAIVVLFLGVVPLTSRAQNDASAQSTLPVSKLSIFGIGGDAHTSLDLTKWMPQMAKIGIHVMRCGSPDNPDQMAYMDSIGFKYGMLLYSVPPNDKLDAPGSLPVKDLDTWKAFVAEQVKKVKGRAAYWELWNEPPNGIGPGQTAADYAKLLVATYDTIKALEPDAVVAMCAKSVHVNWLEQTIQAGGKDHFDCIILHPYEVLGVSVEHTGAEPVFLNIVPTVRKMLAAQDPARVNVPIIFTELGYDAGRGEDKQASALVKAYTMGLVQGVQTIEWFEGMDGDSGPMGLLHYDLSPRKAYTAYGQLIQSLGQHPRYVGWLQFHDKDYGFVFKNDKQQPVLITWAPTGTHDDIDFGGNGNVLDPMTASGGPADTWTITDEPIIVSDIPAALVAEAAANKGKPIPWGGDYAKAKSVSITFGATNVEKGLHTQSAASVAADVIAYGGGSRAGGVPGGNVFMVDPNFLTYTPTPLEVKIVVRRNANNDGAGFKFVYESTKGYKDLGWYTVPDNKQWYTVTYHIDDDEFVSMWGFNFSLNSDGNVYNKYDIQSVTVTKLTP